MKACSVDDCERPARCRGLCNTHYARWFRHGDATTNQRPGYSKHRLFNAWSGMVNRCTNPNHTSYSKYGGRGIFVCDRWRHDFRTWLADMGERPEGMSLDRIDPDGPYSPENCRWATVIEQRANWSKDGQELQRKATSEAATRRWAEYRSGAIPVPEPK